MNRIRYDRFQLELDRGIHMYFVCLLLVLALEFHFKVGNEYKRFEWFDKIANYLTDRFSEKTFFEGWQGIALIILSPILVVYVILNLFDGYSYWIISFCVSFALLFICLGPKSLEKSFEDYFASMKRDDQEAAYLHIQGLCEVSENSDIPEQDELVRNVTRKILTEGQKRYFGVITWFIFLGPLGALFYRLSVIYKDKCAANEFDEHLPKLVQLNHWIGWVPARITALLFLLTGDFMNGFYRIKDYLYDAEANNDQLISETGIASIGLEMGVSVGNVDENIRSLDLVHRTVIFYLVLAAILATVA